MSIQSLIREEYELGLQPSKLYNKLKDKGITRKEITDFLHKEESYQIHKKFVKPEIYIPIIAKYPDQIHQIDIMYMDVYSNTNSHYKYFLVDIDVFTRRLNVIPLKTKSTACVVAAMQKIIATNKPEIIQSDNGSEFTSKQYTDLMKNNNIEVQYIDIGDHHKIGIADRACRTIRELIQRYLEINKTTKYINHLQDIVDSYNNTYHTTIKCSPNEAIKNKDKILSERMKIYNQAIKKEIQYHIGDHVRYIIEKDTIEKGKRSKWSKTIHVIISKTKHSYTLDNGVVCKYYELQPISAIQTKKIIQTRSRTNEPTYEQLKKEKLVKAKLRKESVDTSNIITGKRNRISTNRFHY